MLKLNSVCVLALAFSVPFVVAPEDQDIECPGCDVRAGTGGFTVVDVNNNVLPGWCCGAVARFSPGDQVVDIPGLCICDADLACAQKNDATGCSKILTVEFRLGTAFNVGSFSYLGGSVVVNEPQDPPGNFGKPVGVAMPAQPCDGDTRFVKVFDLYSDSAGAQFLCSIKFNLGCEQCGKCDILE
jgi:hypothetical protein